MAATTPRHFSGRNYRVNGFFRARNFMKIFGLVAICVWLLYHTKYSTSSTIIIVSRYRDLHFAAEKPIDGKEKEEKDEKEEEEFKTKEIEERHDQELEGGKGVNNSLKEERNRKDTQEVREQSYRGDDAASEVPQETRTWSIAGYEVLKEIIDEKSSFSSSEEKQFLGSTLESQEVREQHNTGEEDSEEINEKPEKDVKLPSGSTSGLSVATERDHETDNPSLIEQSEIQRHLAPVVSERTQREGEGGSIVIEMITREKNNHHQKSRLKFFL